ncbi:hypothetical protein TESG_05143 [Trichophyton tonsurans CBS 112818]|uniref:Mediator of RNA polymerase II transcription subunit 4 n=1 Tax=Trichophyton tonsurans (strain CBS 112818) TaxID=647933 RepID=F2S2E3_TRIT1|nr:hypothetical protein TESG_05143 [Trichophyton tonsurans CBS 112818]
MNAEILAPLTSLEARLNALLASITSTPTASGAPAATVSLLEADDALTSALQTLRTHQENYSRILRLRAEALSLEERVRETVRQVGELGDEISAAAGEDDDSDEDSDDEAGSDIGMSGKDNDVTRKNEVDYRLLLGFARRISRYNNEAAADASSARVLSKEPPGGGTAAETNGEVAKEDGVASAGHGQTTGVGIAALPQDTVSWLDETANWTRLMSALPYPSEDRIRMGLMAHLHATAAAEGKDVEKEVEHILKAATQKDISKEETQPAGQGYQLQPDSDSGAAGPGTAAINHQAEKSAGHTAEPPKVKPKLDLDLYDPDDDENM